MFHLSHPTQSNPTEGVCKLRQEQTKGKWTRRLLAFIVSFKQLIPAVTQLSFCKQNKFYMPSLCYVTSSQEASHTLLCQLKTDILMYRDQKLALQYNVLHPSVCFYPQFPPCTSILHLLCYTTNVLQYTVFIKSTITLKFIQNKENLD